MKKTKTSSKARPAVSRARRPRPTLTFSPTAWAKLLFLRDFGDTEVGGFGIASGDDLLSVEDVQLVLQHATAVSVKFDDAAVADFFDEQVDEGRRPEQFARIWLHTHPGDCPRPSRTDEETFERCFGRADWAVMFILARGGQTYARLRFNLGPGGSLKVPVDVDFRLPFPAADHTVWERQYMQCVQAVDAPWGKNFEIGFDACSGDEDFLDAWNEYVEGDLATLTEGREDVSD